jgi:2-keto-4-pentenoate hydratase/2-oxohepta-3-ene-1,7-dioic acid hydratase in catechol pathway
MLFGPVQLVQYISSLLTLEAGDLIFTGTPAGVGKVVPGDKISAKITNISELECRVA